MLPFNNIIFKAVTESCLLLFHFHVLGILYIIKIIELELEIFSKKIVRLKSENLNWSNVNFLVKFSQFGSFLEKYFVLNLTKVQFQLFERGYGVPVERWSR